MILLLKVKLKLNTGALLKVIRQHYFSIVILRLYKIHYSTNPPNPDVLRPALQKIKYILLSDYVKYTLNSFIII